MNIITDIPFEELRETEKRNICKKVKTKCKRYVAGAVYNDMKGYACSFSKKDEYV